MKRIVAILSIMVLAVVAMAQVPQTMNFQALIRNAENQVVTNQAVEIEVSVLNSAQQAVYTETHSVTTSFNGIATLEVGAGTPVNGTFAGIDWSADKYYMETKIQLSDGSDAISDVTPLLSVPYALYAAKSGSADIDLSDYALKSEIPAAVDLTDYALKSEIPAAVDLTDYALKSEIPAEVDLSDYALKSEIPAAVDLTDYALKSEIPAAVDLTDYALKSEIPAEVDLTDYALKSEIPAAVDLTDYAKSADVSETYLTKETFENYVLGAGQPESVDLTVYAKTVDVNAAIANLEAQIPAEVDLTDYALKSEIPAAVDLTDYALKSEIPAAVDLTGYAKSADVESAYAKKTTLNEYAKSGANISIFVNDVEYVKKSYVDSLFNVLKTQIATISNGGGNGGEDGQHENGRIDAKFSVSADKQVYFSQGNLQYQASTKTWKFADHQYDIVGNDNENISSTYSGWIDLFGFGTSGYNEYQPYNSGQYDSYPSSYSIGAINETNYDWGYYNSISNGGGESGLWRTLTGEEWNYLFSSRTNAANLYGAAQVNGVNGIVILPDAWTLPDGVSFTKGFSATLLYELNTYTTTDWAKMEANGAVFLPAVGYRLTTTVNDAGVDGYYWSSMENKSVQFSGEALRTDYQWQRSNGYGVRVVQDAE